MNGGFVREFLLYCFHNILRLFILLITWRTLFRNGAQGVLILRENCQILDLFYNNSLLTQTEIYKSFIHRIWNFFVFSRKQNQLNIQKVMEAGQDVSWQFKLKLSRFPSFLKPQILFSHTRKLFNLFHTTDLFFLSLKRSDNLRFSGAFKGYGKKPLAWNGLKPSKKLVSTLRLSDWIEALTSWYPQHNMIGLS